MTFRHDRYADGSLTERIEIERDSPTTGLYTRFDGALVVQEQRAATPDEYDLLVASEEGEADITAQGNLTGAEATLRSWADDARTVEAQGPAVSDAQLKVMFGRMGTLLDRLADVIRLRGR